MKRWAGALSALGVIAFAIAVVQVLARLTPSVRPDFPAFVMTIEEWNSVRLAYADGRTFGGTAVYRLEYHRRDDWTWTLVSDDGMALEPGQGSACRDGTYGHLDARGAFTATSTDPAMCNGVGRWIHYGIASWYPWKKEVANGLVTLTDPGERVVFDLATGLPVLYEAGSTTGGIGYRMTFRTDRVATSAEVVTCSSTAYTGTVVGAFTISAADLARQDETRGGATGPHPMRSQFRDYPADTPIVLCFFDAFIAAPGGPPGIPPATFRPYDRYVVTVDPSGQGRLAVAGFRDRNVVAPQLP
jgi:hypothetical protein